MFILEQGSRVSPIDRLVPVDRAIHHSESTVSDQTGVVRLHIFDRGPEPCGQGSGVDWNGPERGVREKWDVVRRSFDVSRVPDYNICRTPKRVSVKILRNKPIDFNPSPHRS